MPEQKRVEGLVHFVVYRSDATGYSVVKIYEGDHLPEPQQVDDSDLTTVVGIMPDLSRGDSIQADGKWIENKRYGTQFDARQVQVMEAPPEPLFFQNAGNSRNSDEGDPEATVEGIVERITYYNAENSWCVVKISPEGKIPEDALMTDNTMAVVGVMPELVEGETVRFTGKWTQNRQYGLQLKADTTTPIAPDTKYGVVRYLADTVHGVGERTATKIYDFLGDDTINILDTDPQRIHDVPGIKSQIAENVLEAWATERKLRQVMINLQNFGISTLIARRIYDVYEGSALQVVQSDPYQLAQSIQSIGFRKADGIARRVGIEADAPQRLRAGLHYALQQMSNEGHCFSPREHLVSTACDLLGIAPDNHDILTGLLDTEIRAERLIQQQLVIDDTTLNAVYLPIYFRSEVGATERMNLMQETPSKIIFRMKTLDEAEYLKELAEQNNV
ncbi:MAG: YrrC family ATP-dependent DNA helicase, partial [Aggregatilineales bacterium]